MSRSALCINSPADVQRLEKILASVPCRHCGVTSWERPKSARAVPATPLHAEEMNGERQNYVEKQGPSGDCYTSLLYPGSATNFDSFPPGDPARATEMDR